MQQSKTFGVPPSPCPPSSARVTPYGSIGPGRLWRCSCLWGLRRDPCRTWSGWPRSCWNGTRRHFPLPLAGPWSNSGTTPRLPRWGLIFSAGKGSRARPLSLIRGAAAGSMATGHFCVASPSVWCWLLWRASLRNLKARTVCIRTVCHRIVG